MFVDRFLSIVLYSLFGPRSTQPSQVQWERGARRHFGSALLFALHQWKWGWREHGHCRYAASNGRTQILHSQVTDKMSRSNCCCCHLYITGNSTAVGSLITSSEPRKKNMACSTCCERVHWPVYSLQFYTVQLVAQPVRLVVANPRGWHVRPYG